MREQKIGIINPGEMGVSIAAAAQHSGAQVYWASAGRSSDSLGRALQHHLIDAGTLEQLCTTCTLIISVCPPHAAEQVAGAVLAHGFRGLYLDGNAISPQCAHRIHDRMSAAGVDFVDGGIIGGPAWTPGGTRLYLSGARAEEAAACFTGSPLECVLLGEQTGSASALKMCFAAYTKGSTALLGAILAAAEYWQVREPLAAQWALGDPGFPEQATRRVSRSTAKAWRFAGEMEEIAATFMGAGVPGGFHQAAAEIFRRQAQFKDDPEPPTLEAVLEALLADQ